MGTTDKDNKRKMDNQQIADILIGLCNSILFPKGDKTPAIPSLSAEEWAALLAFASEQGLLSIMVHHFEGIEVEDAATRNVMMKRYTAAIKNSRRYHLRVKIMRKMARIMASEGIDIMFFKGAALAQLYPNPEWRTFSDIDYYLYGKTEQGIKQMAEYGIMNKPYFHHHTQASVNGVLLENHYDFVERLYHRCDILLDDELKALVEKEGKSMPVTFLGDDIDNAYMMTPTMNAIFLMRHMSAHFMGQTIPLRQLYDWALFLQKHAREVDWQLVTKLYEQSGMTRFAGIISQILHSYFNFDCEGCPIPLGEQEEARRVWSSIVYPQKNDPYKKDSLKYYLYEMRTFLANRWKYGIVYPGESYAKLFFMYSYRRACRYWQKLRARLFKGVKN